VRTPGDRSRSEGYFRTKLRQAVEENASVGPLAFFESRTPTLLAENATSTQSVLPLPL